MHTQVYIHQKRHSPIMWNNNLYFDIIQLSQCCNNKSFFTCHSDCSGLVLPDKAWPLTPHFHFYLGLQLKNARQRLIKCIMLWSRAFSSARNPKDIYCNTCGPHSAEANRGVRQLWPLIGIWHHLGVRDRDHSSRLWEQTNMFSTECLIWCKNHWLSVHAQHVKTARKKSEQW